MTRAQELLVPQRARMLIVAAVVVVAALAGMVASTPVLALLLVIAGGARRPAPSRTHAFRHPVCCAAGPDTDKYRDRRGVERHRASSAGDRYPVVPVDDSQWAHLIPPVAAE